MRPLPSICPACHRVGHTLAGRRYAARLAELTGAGVA